MAATPPDEVARRVRAAFAYASLDITKPAPGLAISPSTIARIVSLSKPRGADSDELEQLAAATGVPLSFLRDGFEPEDPTADERIEALEMGQQTLRREIRRLRDAVVQMAAGNLLQAQGLPENSEEGRPRGSRRDDAG